MTDVVGALFKSFIDFQLRQVRLSRQTVDFLERFVLRRRLHRAGGICDPPETETTFGFHDHRIADVKDESPAVEVINFTRRFKPDAHYSLHVDSTFRWVQGSVQAPLTRVASP